MTDNGFVCLPNGGASVTLSTAHSARPFMGIKPLNPQIPQLCESQMAKHCILSILGTCEDGSGRDGALNTLEDPTKNDVQSDDGWSLDWQGAGWIRSQLSRTVSSGVVQDREHACSARRMAFQRPFRNPCPSYVQCLIAGPA